MRALKIALVLAGCGMGAGIAVTGCVVLDSALTVRCVEHDTQSSTFETPSSDTRIQFNIDRCQLDQEACTTLCQLVLDDAVISETLTSCDVSFNGSSSVTVNAHFDRQTNNPGCSGGVLTPGGDDVVNGGGAGGGTTIILDAGGPVTKPFPDASVVPD